MADYANPDVLISDEELEARLGDPSLRIIEVDEDTSLYGKGHIPGAIAWNWKTDLHDRLRRDFLYQKQLSALLDEVISAVEGGQTAYVDVRSPEEYRGDLLAPPHLPQEQAQVPGHIPGAANVPWSKAANEDGTFKSADDLKELYAGVGITGDKPTIAYCRIGERSSHTWFALTEL